MESTSKQPIEQLVANRIAKLDELRELGLEPFPTRYRVDESVRAAKSRFTDATAARMPKNTVETSAVALGDVDGDGDLDALDANWGMALLSAAPCQPTSAASGGPARRRAARVAPPAARATASMTLSPTCRPAAW